MSATWPHRIARFVVRVAMILAPSEARRSMRAEWEAELDEAFRQGGRWELPRASLGAFADALTARAVQRSRRTSGRRPQRWLAGLPGDVRSAWRGLWRSPGFTVVSIVTIAVGLGGITAIYTLIDRVVLDPLPYPEAGRLVRLQNQVPGVGPNERWNLSTAQWVHFTRLSETMDEVGIYTSGDIGTGANVMTRSGAQRARGVAVTASMMDLLGARAWTGRVLDEEDDRPGADPVVMISHAFWTQNFGGDPSVVGSTISIQDEPFEVIGVMAPDVELPGWPTDLAPDLWSPLRIDPDGSFGNNHVFPAVARLAPGATPDDAEAEIGRLTGLLPAAFPDAYSQAFFDRYGFRTIATPLKEAVVGDLSRNLWILMAGVSLVLLIACANVVNLFAVRTEGRRRELSIRTALGASRAALARYVLTEGALLSLVGGGFAALLSFWAIPAVTGMAPGDLPGIHAARLGPDGVALTLGLALAIGVGIAALGLLAHGGSQLAPGLPEGGRAGTAGPRTQRLRSGLVAAQVGLALTLTVGAVLLIQGLRQLSTSDVGFDPDGVLAVDLYLNRSRYPSDVDVWNVYRAVQERVAALPGVSSAGLGEALPISGRFGCTLQGFEDASVADRITQAGLTACAGQERVTPGYFQTLGIPVLEGRALEAADVDRPTSASVVVSRAFAERFWPGESALGKGVGPSGRSSPPFYHVVGVVGDVPRASGGREGPFSERAIAVYYPVVHNPDLPGTWSGWWPGYQTLVVRSRAASPLSLVSSVRSAIDEVDPEIPVANARAMESVVASALAQVSFVSLLLGIAAAVALVLAAVGLYGVISYIVTCRTKEFGVRLAIGARPGEVERMVLGRTMVLVAIGLAAGVPLAWAATRVTRSVLVGVDPTEPLAYVSAAAILTLVALAASWIPARRASSVDPMDALRPD